MRLGLAFSIAAVCGLLAPAIVRAQEAAPPPSSPAAYSYEFAASTVPMIRNAQLFSTAGALVDRAAGAAVDGVTGGLFEKRGWQGIASRIAKLYFLEMPLASLAQTANHEYGHITHYPWYLTHSLHIEGWPWPVPITRPRVDGTVSRPFYDLTLPENLALTSGGTEASTVLADTVMDRVYATNRASCFDVTLYVYAKLDVTAYAVVRGSWVQGDPWRFAEELAKIRARPLAYVPSENPNTVLHSIRRAAWLNLLDYTLVGNIERVVVDSLVRGQPVVDAAWLKVGPLRLVPGFNYTPTPVGQQYALASRIGTGTTTSRVYVRWTGRLQAEDVPGRVAQWNEVFRAWNEGRPPEKQYKMLTVPAVWRLVGMGGELRWTTARTVAPSVAADAWRDVNGRFGGRAELGLTWRHPAFGPRNAVRFAAGGKSAGYLTGFPMDRGMYVSAGLVTQF